MNRDYWESVGDAYEEEIFSVLKHDTDELIRARIIRFAQSGGTAADLGCGVGHFLPLLSAHFGRVLACDLSDGLLEQALRNHGHLRNITFRRADLARQPAVFPPADLALCINVIITSRLAARTRTLDNLSLYLKPGGHLILVVPSLESALLTSSRIIQWNQRAGQSAAQAERSGLPVRGSVRQIHRGNVPIDGVLTKHYLKEELSFLLPDHGIEVEEIEKLEYPWTSEFEEPPAWMEAPFPWDWLVVGRRP